MLNVDGVLQKSEVCRSQDDATCTGCEAFTFVILDEMGRQNEANDTIAIRTGNRTRVFRG